MSTADYRETAPLLLHLGTGAIVGLGAFLLLPVYPRRCRMLASPMSTQTALCTILSTIASAWTPQPSLGCQSFFLNWVQKTEEVVPNLSSISSSNIDLNSASGLPSSHRRPQSQDLPGPNPSRHVEPPRSLDCMPSPSVTGARENTFNGGAERQYSTG